MTADVEQKAARQHDELIRELLDSRIPKSEREHAAAREIERLREEVAEQCRLHAIGMERELALITERDRLQAEVEFLRRGIVPRDDDMIVPAKLLDEINASGAEWKDRAERLAEEVEALRSEVGRVNSWNERVSVCRDHVADIVDGPCVICALDAVEAHADRMWAEADRLAKEVIRIQQQYDERTACVSSSTRYERELKEWIERGRTAEEKAAALKWLEDMRAWALRQENSND